MGTLAEATGIGCTIAGLRCVLGDRAARKAKSASATTKPSAATAPIPMKNSPPRPNRSCSKGLERVLEPPSTAAVEEAGTSGGDGTGGGLGGGGLGRGGGGGGGGQSPRCVWERERERERETVRETRWATQ
jgi:hypothetical protein